MKKIATLLLSIILFVALAFTPTEAHAGTANGAVTNFSAGSFRLYAGYSTVVTTSNSATALQRTKSTNDTAATGFLGARACLYRNGAIAIQDNWRYNGSAVALGTYYAPPGCAENKVSASYFARGTSAGWSGSGYVTKVTSQSPNQN